MKTMKPGVSSLNPYAASYIPLAKREANDNVTAKHSNENAWFEPSLHFAHKPHYSGASLESVAHGTKKHQVAEGSAVKSHPGCGFLMQNPGEMIDKQFMDEEFDMDLEYLRMTFPDLSNESLMDAYLANDGDFEATVDILNQLEMHAVESSELLPDTLDIGDISESGSSATCSPLKLKNMAGETSASSSGTGNQLLHHDRLSRRIF
ncbi:dnaJ-like protein subfamily B member 4-like [Hibiscus syriacus]|uniref:DnaJ-like protein subfamily B member 4-like n=1 Tax=Hibiscus syriacus TaxID=106335 RepID=A0A6A3AQ28_HIBSY|nr:polyadenylate-binding protein-interacting protein 5-like [Hibiscus syriacus]XP_038998825.1 polyadenylate-binding protein-interacting protein 5-like [Hibiscus syriacus]KAE8705913.1 dnaJ-like protein subfamily B member 4-like [Hibiscus syriacus]